MNNKLELTKQVMDQAKTVVAILEIGAVRENYINSYNRATRTNNGEMKFETEKALFAQAAIANKKIDECDPFTKYNAFMELCGSGLTLRDGLSYMVPMKNVLVWMPGWRGRLEQLQEIPEVEFCYEPEVVYDCDIFKYSKGQGGIKVIEHIPNGKHERTEQSKITDVYFIIDRAGGKQVTYHMQALDVYKIRAKSPSFKDYIKTLSNQKNKEAGKVFGDTLIGLYRDKNQQWKEFPIDPPMWITDEAQAFKKTIVKRTYLTYPNKLKKHKEQDAAVVENIKQAGVQTDEYVDPDDGPVITNEDTANPSGHSDADDVYTQYEDIPNGNQSTTNSGISADDTEGDSF